MKPFLLFPARLRAEGLSVIGGGYGDKGLPRARPEVAAHYADDIKWLGLAGEKASFDGEGRTAVEKGLAGYFKPLSDVRAETSDVTQTGPRVSFRERVTWTARDGARRAQSAIGVYDVRDGKIARAGQFPAARDPAPATAKK